MVVSKVTGKAQTKTAKHSTEKTGNTKSKIWHGILIYFHCVCLL